MTAVTGEENARAATVRPTVSLNVKLIVECGRWFAASVVAFLVLASVSACDSKEKSERTPPSNPPPSSSANPSGPLPDADKSGTGMDDPSKNPQGAPGDAVITAKVKSALIADKTIRARTVNVDTKSNVVVLRGTVENEAAVKKAEQIARKTQGVEEVINQLKVKK
jgi:hyperosmotically inducible protein